MATLLKTDGIGTEVEPKNGTDFQLEELQKFVGGYIEIIQLNDGRIMVVNEEGKLQSLEMNDEATEIATEHHALFDGDWICGDVLICNEREVQ